MLCFKRPFFRVVLWKCVEFSMGVSKNSGTGFSIINHPFWGTPIFGNIPITGEIY